MATGLPYRQPGRQSFANQVAAPTQTTTGASGESRGVQSVGGESIGGVQGGAYSRTGNAAAGVGNIFAELMAPQIARKKQEKFFQGFVAAKSGQALEELTDNDSPLTKIFGPSGFAEGAQFYAGKEALSNWTSQQMEEMGTLKQLSPDDFAVHLTDSLDQFMTGDPGADAHIMSGFVEANAGLASAHATERYAWQQTEALQSWHASTNAQANLLQKTVSEFGIDSEIAAETFTQFAQGFVKPEGMADEAYMGAVEGSLELQMTQGNFFAVEVARQAGVMNILSPEAQAKLTRTYRTEAAHAQDMELQNNPAIRAEVLKLHANRLLMEQGAEGMSPLEAIEVQQNINRMFREAVGSTMDYYDGEDFIREGESWSESAARRIGKQLDEARRANDAAHAAQVEGQLVLSTLASGNFDAATRAGLSTTALETGAMAQVEAGDFSGIENVFLKDHYVFSGVQRRIAAKVEAGIGDEYTDLTEVAYQGWLRMYKKNPAMAAAYYGDNHGRMQIFHNNMDNKVPAEFAYKAAFAFPAGGRQTVSVAQAEGVRGAFDDARDDMADSVWNFGGAGQIGNVSERFTTEWYNIVQDQVAKEMAISPDLPDVITDRVTRASLANGIAEAYGDYGWVNGRPTTPLHKALGVAAERVGDILDPVIEAKLQETGLTDYASLQIIRSTNRGLLVMAVDDDEEVLGVFGIPLHDIVGSTQLDVQKDQGAGNWLQNYGAAQGNTAPTAIAGGISK